MSPGFRLPFAVVAAVLRCRGCGGLNNYGGIRAGKVARCGLCRVALDVSGKLQGIREEELARTVEGSPVPVVLLVWDPADPVCRTVAAALERISARNLGAMVAVAVDVEVHPEFPRSQRIETLPTFVLYRAQAEAGRFAGVLEETPLARWILAGEPPVTVH